AGVPRDPARSVRGGRGSRPLPALHRAGRGSGLTVADVSNSAQNTAASDEPLLRAVGLTKHFRLGGMFSKHLLHAVDELDLTIGEREIVALVGESGSGKSTVARLLARIYKPTQGEIFYRGRPLHT